jgi:hypothetical protein
MVETSLYGGDDGYHFRREMKMKSSIVFATAVLLVVGAVLAESYLNSTSRGGTTVTQTSSTTTSSSGIQGIVTGYVTVGPSQPVCSANQTCNMDMSGYRLVFTPQCPRSSSNCQASMAALSSSGHYSILLPAGNYSVTGLDPSCNWLGCASAFPKTVGVEGGMQLVFNIDIDTGIR